MPSPRQNYGAGTYKKLNKQHPNTKWTKDIVAKWDKLLRSGMNQKAVAQKYGISPLTVGKKIAEFRGI